MDDFVLLFPLFPNQQLRRDRAMVFLILRKVQGAEGGRETNWGETRKSFLGADVEQGPESRGGFGEAAGDRGRPLRSLAGSSRSKGPDRESTGPKAGLRAALGSWSTRWGLWQAELCPQAQGQWDDGCSRVGESCFLSQSPDLDHGPLCCALLVPTPLQDP